MEIRALASAVPLPTFKSCISQSAVAYAELANARAKSLRWRLDLAHSEERLRKSQPADLEM